MSVPLVLLGQSFGSLFTCLVLLGFAVFLILLVLVQRGKGGGLSGAFGGMGGQSAFGTKAGDTFTRITVVTATLWIVSCIIAAKYLGVSATNRFSAAQSDATTSADMAPGNPLSSGLSTEDGLEADGLGSGGLGSGSLDSDATQPSGANATAQDAVSAEGASSSEDASDSTPSDSTPSDETE